MNFFPQILHVRSLKHPIPLGYLDSKSYQSTLLQGEIIQLYFAKTHYNKTTDNSLGLLVEVFTLVILSTDLVRLGLVGQEIADMFQGGTPLGSAGLMGLETLTLIPCKANVQEPGRTRVRFLQGGLFPVVPAGRGQSTSGAGEGKIPGFPGTVLDHFQPTIPRIY